VIALLVGIALAPLLSTRAAEPARMFHVGMVNLNSPRSAPFNVAFEQRLRERGYVEGHNLAIDFLGLDGHLDRLPEAMEELVRRKVDVILAAGQEVVLKAAKQATGTIPIVMIAISYDPVALGYVGSLARPGGNITGVFSGNPS
jgi:putative ABC transport system substrate-binding protein